MNTIEEAVESIRAFEEARKDEGYKLDASSSVLHRVPLMEYVPGKDGEAKFGFDLKAGVTDNGDGKGWVGDGSWEFAFKFRDIVCIGSTPEDAIAAALASVCKLGRDGSVDPSDPNKQGAPPIQHCISVLQERLAWYADRRRDAIIDRNDFAGKNGELSGAQFLDRGTNERHVNAVSMAEVKYGPLLEQYGNAIAALGTAIAALARIKDL